MLNRHKATVLERYTSSLGGHRDMKRQIGQSCAENFEAGA